MLSIRCPQCGMINQDDDVGFPLCGQCHADLVLCPACRHFGDDRCAHRDGYQHFVPDMSGAKRCPHFFSRCEAPGSRLMRELPAAVWVPCLLVLLVLGLTAAAWFLDPALRYFRGNPLGLETAVPQQVSVGKAFVVTMRVTNLFNQTSTRIYVEIDGKFLAIADPGMPFPLPERISRYRDRILFVYQPLPSGAQRTLQLPFIPRRKGVAVFVAKVYAPSNQLCHEVNVPVVVQDAGMTMERNGGHSDVGGRQEDPAATAARAPSKAVPRPDRHEG